MESPNASNILICTTQDDIQQSTKRKEENNKDMHYMHSTSHGLSGEEKSLPLHFCESLIGGCQNSHHGPKKYTKEVGEVPSQD